MKNKPIVIEHYIPIPEILYSIETGKAFDRCIECGKNILQKGTRYIIQKGFKDGEPVMDYAHCIDCYNRLENAYSKQSMKRIWNFILDSVNFESRNKELWKSSNGLSEYFEAWINGCLTCGTLRENCSRYAICAWCDEGDVLLYNLPYMFCDKCVDALIELLSKETKDEWDRWQEANLDFPPSIEGEIPDKKFVFI